MACYWLQTQAGVSRTEIVGGEEIVYCWSDNKLRPMIVRRLGMPIRAFLAYLTMIERINQEQQKQMRKNQNAKRPRY